MPALRNIRRDRSRCLCGLRISLHFTADNRKLDCWEAAAQHQQATLKRRSLRELLFASRRVDGHR